MTEIEEPEVSFSTDDGQNPGHPDKRQPPNQQDRKDGSSRGIIQTRSGRISKAVHYLGT